MSDEFVGDFGPGKPGQDPNSYSEQLKAERGAKLDYAVPMIAKLLYDVLPNVKTVRLVASFDDGMEIGGTLNIVGVLRPDQLRQMSPAFLAGLAEMLVATGVPKRSGKRRRKNPAFKPVENPPEKGGPE